MAGILIFAGLLALGSSHYTTFSRAVHDARTFDAFGGFAEFRRAWRRYNYARDHALMCSASGSGDDIFLYGQGATPWLFWHGQVAEQVAYVERWAAAVDMIIDDSGGAATGMDTYRQTSYYVWCAGTIANEMSVAGLHAQAASVLRQVGLHEVAKRLFVTLH